jgi:hypothetical protein
MKRIIIILLVVFGALFIFFRPNDARALWTTINLRIKTVLVGDQAEYSPPRSYFMASPLQILRWVEFGHIVELTDYSKWELEEEVNWGISDEITVEFSPDPAWPYFLGNVGQDERFQARYLGKD